MNMAVAEGLGMHWIGLVEQPVADGMEVTTQRSWRLRANALHVVLAKEVSDLSSLFSILSAVGKAVQADGDAVGIPCSVTETSDWIPFRAMDLKL